MYTSNHIKYTTKKFNKTFIGTCWWWVGFNIGVGGGGGG